MNTSCLGKLPRSRIAFLFSTLLLACGLLLQGTAAAQASQDESRKVKKSVPAEYPELARKFNLRGSVRLQILISPEGRVKEAKVLGGNPVLVNAFVQAVMKWEYEPAGHSSTVVVTADFKP